MRYLRVVVRNRDSDARVVVVLRIVGGGHAAGHLYEPLDEIAADRLEQLIADAIAHRTRTEPGLEL